MDSEERKKSKIKSKENKVGKRDEVVNIQLLESVWTYGNL